MRLRNPLISVATILTLTALPAFAAPIGGPAKPGPSAAAATHGSAKSTTSAAPKAAAPKTTTTHGQSASTHGAPKTATTTTSSAPKTTAAGHGHAKTTAATTSTSGSASTGTTTPQLNPIAQKISSKTQLNSKVTTMLPNGITLNEASKGFKNQGQFIAALHVSQNLNIPFADLKQAMTGIRPMPKTTTTGGTTTGSATTTTTTEPTQLLSLGQAIHKLRPSADATSAETTATTQATADLGGK